jgi:flavin-binding protein dodecin
MLLTSERARSGADADQSQENSIANQQRRQISPQDDTEQQIDTVYKVVDVVGVSEKSWEDAGRNAVETAAGSLRDLRVAEVTKMDMKLENGRSRHFAHASRSPSNTEPILFANLSAGSPGGAGRSHRRR